jgi:hypothetical protein
MKAVLESPRWRLPQVIDRAEKNTVVPASEPRRHHYVPQFYLRRLACADDPNKVMVVERHRDILASDRKSIDRIGWEEGLHNYVENGIAGSVEGELNKTIETPFSDSPTWAKIESGDFAALTKADGLSIYGFARHLQRRNVATLRFMQQEHERFLSDAPTDHTEEEREMHRWVAGTPGGAHRLFREGALDTSLPDDAHAINVMICQAPIPFRSSTNPTLMVSQPGRESVFGQMFNSLRTWWLTLDRHWGAFIVAGGPPGFSSTSVDPRVARVINQRYLVQLLHGDARYMLADDPYLEPDLKWAGFAFEQSTTRGFRFRADTWKDPPDRT